VVIAFTAQGHIAVGTADELLGRALARAEGIVGVRRADFADGRQLLDLFAQRYQFEDVLPAFLLVRAIESRHNDDLTGVRSCFGEINDLKSTINMSKKVIALLTSSKNWPSSMPITSNIIQSSRDT
jgi:hypothetical protein